MCSTPDSFSDLDPVRAAGNVRDYAEENDPTREVNEAADQFGDWADETGAKVRGGFDQFGNWLGEGGNSAGDAATGAYWATIQPLLAKVMGEGSRIYDQNGDIHPELSGTTQDALNRLISRGQNGSPIMDAGNSSLMSLLNGGTMNPALGYLSPFMTPGTNPGSQYAMDAMGKPVQGYDFINQGIQRVGNNPAVGMINDAVNSENPALSYIKNTASGGAMSGNPYFESALDKSLEKIKSNYMDIAVPTIQGKFGLSGGFNRHGESDALDKARAEAGGLMSSAANNAYLDNFNKERAYQDTAQGRLADVGQQGINNRFTGANAISNIFSGDTGTLFDAGKTFNQFGNSDIANKFTGAGILSDNYDKGQDRGLRATGMYGDTYNAGNDALLRSIGMAPTMANQDYVDLDSLLKAGNIQDTWNTGEANQDWTRLNLLNGVLGGRAPGAPGAPGETNFDKVLKLATAGGLLFGG